MELKIYVYKIFKLIHAYDNGYGCLNEKKIGFYSKKKIVEKKIEMYRKKPGFCDKPNDFYIKEYFIKSELPVVDLVYQIAYSYENKDSCEEIKEIGLFLSKEKAKKVFKKFRAENKINIDYEELYFGEYYLNEDDDWKSGFFNPFLEDE